MANEFIKLDTTIIAIDKLINEAPTGTMARTLLKVKETIYNQQRYVVNVPEKCGKATYKPVKTWEDIKIICSKRKYCQDTEKGNCQFYDKNSGYCIFEDMPEDWNIEENNEKTKNLTDEETDIYNSQLEAEAETIEKVSLLSEKSEYKDPCKYCHNGVCEQCYYGYCSEEDKKKKWLENHKKEGAKNE